MDDGSSDDSDSSDNSVSDDSDSSDDSDVSDDCWAWDNSDFDDVKSESEDASLVDSFGSDNLLDQFFDDLLWFIGFLCFFDFFDQFFNDSLFFVHLFNVFGNFFCELDDL